MYFQSKYNSIPIKKIANFYSEEVKKEDSISEESKLIYNHIETKLLSWGKSI